MGLIEGGIGPSSTVNRKMAGGVMEYICKKNLEVQYK